MINIPRLIRALFLNYIYYPFLRFWNYYVNHAYIEYNERNAALI